MEQKDNSLMRNIEKHSFWYSFLRPIVAFAFRISNKNLIIVGRKNIPKNKPIIFAINHQNALIDALAIVFTSRLQPVFLARADIFKGKLVSSFLHFVKMIPVYRIRDGYENLDKNNETFDTAFRILKANQTLALFPEGAHTPLRSMLPHKKAIARIVSIANMQTNGNLDIQVVPVGLYYNGYANFRRSMRIEYGEPISAKAYYDALSQNENQGSTLLRDRIYNEIDALTLNIRDKNNYEVYDELRHIVRFAVYKKLGFKRSNFAAEVAVDKFSVQKAEAIIAQNNEDSERLIDLVLSHKKYREQLGLDNLTINKGGVNSFNYLIQILSIIFATPFLLGYIVNAIPYYYIRKTVKSKVKDPQFVSSFSFGLGLFAFPIWHLAIAGIISTIFSLGWYFLLLPPIFLVTGIAAYDLMNYMVSLGKRLRHNNQIRNATKGIMDLYILRESIIMEIAD